MIGVYNQDHIDSKNLGRKEGRKERELEFAKMMLQRNESIDKLIDYTGLSRSEVEAIKAKL